jgi:multidrug efflux pump subunit AcrA (membrane-fusion protein)
MSLKSFATRKITKLFVHENQQITENTIVAIIENTGNYEDVKMLKAIFQRNVKK